MRCSCVIPDVAGRLPRASVIAPEAPASLALRTPGQRLVAAARAAGVPAALSGDAGGYLCNYLCWRASEAAGGPPLIAFVHVPQICRANISSPGRAQTAVYASRSHPRRRGNRRRRTRGGADAPLRLCHINLPRNFTRRPVAAHGIRPHICKDRTPWRPCHASRSPSFLSF